MPTMNMSQLRKALAIVESNYGSSSRVEAQGSAEEIEYVAVDKADIATSPHVVVLITDPYYIGDNGLEPNSKWCMAIRAAGDGTDDLEIVVRPRPPRSPWKKVGE